MSRDRAFDRGVASTDIPHNFKFSNVWQVPKLNVHGPAGKLFEGYGLSVSEWLPLEIAVSDTTRRYLKTKKEKLGHRLSGV